jgi:hypothetical protein
MVTLESKVSEVVPVRAEIMGSTLGNPSYFPVKGTTTGVTGEGENASRAHWFALFAADYEVTAAPSGSMSSSGGGGAY